MKPEHPDHVALFGEVLADLFPDERILGGAPFNVARHLRAFGLRPLLISRTGRDALGDTLLREMAHLDMDISGMQSDPEHPTGQVQVILDHGSHRFEILPNQAYDHLCARRTCEALTVAKPALAYFGTLAQRHAVSRAAARRFLEDCACPIFLDINLRAPWYDAEIIAESLTAADIVKLNEDELTVVADLFGFGGLPSERQAAELLQRFGLSQVIVTCGAAGCWLLGGNQHLLKAGPADPGKTIIDTVGAGDAFSAVFILGLLRAWDAPVTLLRASEYATAICGIRGAAPASPTFGQRFMQAWDFVESAAMPDNPLLETETCPRTKH